MTEEKQGAAEWLREIAQRKCNCHEVVRMFGFACGESPCTECIPRLVGAIAQRVEKERALPEGVEWPRFEDGELVKVGDEVEFKGETMRVCLATLDADGWSLRCERRGVDGVLYGSFGERVKRPAPEVLDADGVPIEVGDVVYYDGEPHPLTVVGITCDGKDALVDANGEESCVEGGRPQDFSHDAPKPVLDADGAPINVGDTVYCNGEDKPLRVIHITDSIKVALLDGHTSYFRANPSRLSHARPDSWEKLEEDANLGCRDYCEKHRLEECDYNMRVHILARAKKLAGVEEEAQR